ncbi:MotA/TolQ/ExbB proton channel family protein [Lutimaribacter marinistellae]|uniref:MotA/TolQ/ExbB proton channel family protein n=1 Tax=Lutimaribacter marinistellae TaxID=1820329 RepID=A0ABV7TC87_9RHOB
MNFFETLAGLFALGGPVVAVLLFMSVLTMSVVLYKIWQFSVSGVGRHRVLADALKLWDAGDTAAASERLQASRSYLAPFVGKAMKGHGRAGVDDRLDAEVGQAFALLERGFRLLDTIAQIAPLLGLFGTVLGMIDAFRSLQGAGSTVDPSVLAGGIWVALLTTAVGLAVAIPTSMVLAWFESRMARERVFADKALRTVLAPENDAADLSIATHA